MLRVLGGRCSVELPEFRVLGRISAEDRSYISRLRFHLLGRRFYCCLLAPNRGCFGVGDGRACLVL